MKGPSEDRWVCHLTHAEESAECLLQLPTHSLADVSREGSRIRDFIFAIAESVQVDGRSVFCNRWASYVPQVEPKEQLVLYFLKGFKGLKNESFSSFTHLLLL